ncbi:MAG TPA: S1/P1 nuclease, partial [Gammaproteobacteria bacterium]|nr:S1/P1 nuclease [Gammaproteobacteria bacterium]
LAALRDPPEGDVLEAIARFRIELADRALPAGERLDALRFLVHFVVDVHQPLHVGRADDRGGNGVDVRYAGTVVNLHRFWDTDVIWLRGLSPRRYARMLAPRIDAAAAGGAPRDWAAESLALRSTVYDFPAGRGARPVALDAKYIGRAQRVIEERLVRAGGRLAATLNAVFCGE